MTDPAPWADDAAAYFGDNAEAIEAFDRYQREKAQPYITKLQTESAPARELWTKLNDAPDDALRELVGLVYEDHPDVVSGYETLFAEPAPGPAAAAPAADEPPAWAKPLIESHQEKVDREAREAGEREYQEYKQGLKERYKLDDDDLELVDPFIAGAKDEETAIAKFKAYQAKFGPPVAEPVADPPPVLGSSGSAATPPLATEYKTWEQRGDALRAFTARQAASATPPPVVG